jgi:dienelactone hydrolase
VDRMRWIFFLCSMLVASHGYPQNSSVFSWQSNDMLNKYLLRQLYHLSDSRRLQLDHAFSSEENFKNYQLSLSKRYSNILGEMPTKTPINPITRGVIDQNGYRIEKIIFESVPGSRVTAHLYVPNGKGPFPAVVVLCGHELLGKSAAHNQLTAHILALNGFVAMVVDPISQGERVQYVDNRGRMLTRGATTEHTLLHAGSILVGNSLATLSLWDNIRAIDYLETRQEVDKGRIGCIGTSGGGNQAAYLSAYDQRIKIVVVSSFLTSRERYFETAGPQDGCQQLVHEGKEQFEIADFFLIQAPKPLLVMSGLYDFVDYRGATNSFAEIHKAYSILGKTENAKMVTFEEGHGLSKKQITEAVAWFRKCFYKDEAIVKDHEFQPLSAKDLQCTVSGQVVLAYANEKTVSERNLDLFKQNNAQRIAFAKLGLEAKRSKVKSLLGIVDDKNKIDFEVIDNTQHGINGIYKLVIKKDGELPLPCILYVPNNEMTIKETVVFLHSEGKFYIAQNDSLLTSLLIGGNAVLLADLRGMGETMDDPAKNHVKYMNNEYRNAVISLHLGRPIIGQRVIDIFSLVDFLKHHQSTANKPIKIISEGASNSAVVHAVFLDQRINRAEFVGEMPSFKDYVENPLREDMLSHLFPGALKFYDLPDLVKMCGIGRISFERKQIIVKK